MNKITFTAGDSQMFAAGDTIAIKTADGRWLPAMIVQTWAGHVAAIDLREGNRWMVGLDVKDAYELEESTVKALVNGREFKRISNVVINPKEG